VKNPMLKAALMAAVGLVAAGSAHASLAVSYQFVGQGNWSLDAVGSNNTPVGTLQAFVPVGATVQKAFLYSSSSGAPTSSVTLDGTTYSSFTALGANSFLQAYRVDVTSQVQAATAGGSAVPFVFSVDSENPNGDIDGEALAVVYSLASGPVRTIAFLDGFSASGGDGFNFTSSPLPDVTASGFEALLSLGIGFGYQPSGQYSQVDVGGRRLTTSAGGQDDGIPPIANGTLITMGGIGDSTSNPADPYLDGNVGPLYDDELYDLAQGNGVNASPFISTGQTVINVRTLNPSGDDNIFFAGFNITAEGNVTPSIPLPAALWGGLGLLGLLGARRIRRRA
jgi:hypothetical protein